MPGSQPRMGKPSGAALGGALAVALALALGPGALAPAAAAPVGAFSAAPAAARRAVAPVGGGEGAAHYRNTVAVEPRAVPHPVPVTDTAAP